MFLWQQELQNREVSHYAPKAIETLTGHGDRSGQGDVGKIRGVAECRVQLSARRQQPTWTGDDPSRVVIQQQKNRRLLANTSRL